MSIQYSGRAGLLGQLMQSQERNSRRQADAIKAMFPSDTEKRQKLNLMFGNSLLEKASPGKMFQVGKKNKLDLNADFSFDFPTIEEARTQYKQMAADNNIIPDMMAFEQSYEEANNIYRGRISQSLNSATANFSQDDIKKAITANPELQSYITNQSVVDAQLSPFKSTKKGIGSKILEGSKDIGGGIAGASAISGLVGYSEKGGGRKAKLGRAYKAAGRPIASLGRGIKGAFQPFKTAETGLDILTGRKGIFKNLDTGDIAPKDKKFIQKLADRLNLSYTNIGKGDLDKEGKRALKMLKNVYKREGIKGIYDPLVKKVGRKKALMLLARAGVGGAASFSGLGSLPGIALNMYTAYEIYDTIKDLINDENKMAAGTTF